MEIEKKDYRLLQKIAEDEYLLIHPETNAGNVLIEAEGIEANTVFSSSLSATFITSKERVLSFLR